MKVFELEKEFTETLEMKKFPFDMSLNGLQCGRADKEVKKIVFAVDANLATIESAVEEGADMLFVHHGLFWGSPIAITGTHYERVKLMMDNDLSLFACHLPLDAHPALGNNAQMAIRLGMKSYDPFSFYKGEYIGVKGELPFPMSTEEIAALLNFAPSSGLKVFPFGKEEIKTVAIVSGSAAFDINDAIAEGVDCFITGEMKHEVFSTAVENNINVIAGGHYQSEVFGVQAVMRMVQAKFDIETEFIDVPTGL